VTPDADWRDEGHIRRAAAVVVLSLLLAKGHRAGAAVADAGVLEGPDAPLVQPLPELEEPELDEATPEQLARLDSFIDQLLAPELEARTEALARLRQVDASWLPALVQRFESLARTANKAALAVLLERLRTRQREQPEPDTRGAKGRGSEPRRSVPSDYLEAVVAHPDRSSTFLRPLTEVLAFSRMFEAIATLPAARQVLAVYIRFGDFLRVDTELALTRMQDAAIAALIEATAHPAPRIAEWAKKRLEVAGKLVASEAVQVQDPVLRADILRAYGKTRDVETGRLLISFAASERAQVRLAARQAVNLLGEAGLWQLRDAYAKAVGKRAPSDWSWQRVAEELFAEFDRQRLSELYRLYARGRVAAESGDLAAAREAFDQVLAWDPTFERGAQMAPIYLALGEREAESNPEAAGLALRRAERLAPEGPTRQRAQSLRYTLDARALLARGIVDEVLVQRARELDPTNERAAVLEQDLQRRSQGNQTAFLRYTAAATILAMTLIALIITALRQRRTKPAPS
jgi:tetratricopeptide (TPR) repeat protein